MDYLKLLEDFNYDGISSDFINDLKKFKELLNELNSNPETLENFRKRIRLSIKRFNVEVNKTEDIFLKLV